MAEETNFFSKDNNTLILDCSSESKSCVCSNILNNDKKSIWLSEVGFPQSFTIDFSKIYQKPIQFKCFGIYCWHAYSTNPKHIEVFFAYDNNNFIPWGNFELALKPGTQYFSIEPVNTNKYKYFKLVITESYGGNKIYINKFFMFEDFPEIEGNEIEESVRKDNISKTDNSNLDKKICTVDLEQVYYDEPKQQKVGKNFLRTETEEDLDYSMNSINKPNKLKAYIEKNKLNKHNKKQNITSNLTNNLSDNKFEYENKAITQNKTFKDSQIFKESQHSPLQFRDDDNANSRYNYKNPIKYENNIKQENNIDELEEQADNLYYVEVDDGNNNEDNNEDEGEGNVGNEGNDYVYPNDNENNNVNNFENNDDNSNSNRRQQEYQNRSESGEFRRKPTNQRSSDDVLNYNNKSTSNYGNNYGTHIKHKGTNHSNYESNKRNENNQNQYINKTNNINNNNSFTNDNHKNVRTNNNNQTNNRNNNHINNQTNNQTNNKSNNQTNIQRNNQTTINKNNHNNLNNNLNNYLESDDISVKLSTQNNNNFSPQNKNSKISKNSMNSKNSHRSSLDDQLKDMENALKNMNPEKAMQDKRIIERNYNTGPNFNKEIDKERERINTASELPFNKSTGKPNMIENFYKKNNLHNILEDKNKDLDYLEDFHEPQEPHFINKSVINQEISRLNITPSNFNKPMLSSIKLEDKITNLEKEISNLKISFDTLLDKVSNIVEVKNSLNSENINYILDECKKMVLGSRNIKPIQTENNNKLSLNNLLFDNSKINPDDSYAKSADINHINNKDSNLLNLNEKKILEYIQNKFEGLEERIENTISSLVDTNRYNERGDKGDKNYNNSNRNTGTGITSILKNNNDNLLSFGEAELKKKKNKGDDIDNVVKQLQDKLLEKEKKINELHTIQKKSYQSKSKKNKFLDN